MIRILAAAMTAAVLFAGTSPSGAQTAPAAPSAAPSVAPGAQLVRFAGQLLDVRSGYVFFTTGDAFRTVPNLRLVDYDTGHATDRRPTPRTYALAVLDPASHSVTELEISRHPIPAERSFAEVQGYAVAATTPAPNPELKPGKPITGKEVPVTFIVEVPPETPLDESVYVSTDASAWNPQAIKLDRVDAVHYRVVRRFASGTQFAYRVTRGSWNAVERGQNGLEVTHRFLVHEVDAEFARAIVYHWSDERNGNTIQVSPDAIPTPFNSNPFPPGGIFPGPNGSRVPGGATPPPAAPPNLPH